MYAHSQHNTDVIALLILVYVMHMMTIITLTKIKPMAWVVVRSERIVLLLHHKYLVQKYCLFIFY